MPRSLLLLDGEETRRLKRGSKKCGKVAIVRNGGGLGKGSKSTDETMALCYVLELKSTGLGDDDELVIRWEEYLQE